MNREEVLVIYDEIVNQCDRFERKGKTMPYTSANGHMFSLLNKDGELGMRFSNDVHKAYLEKYKTKQFRSYNANMKGYIVIPETMLDDQEQLIELLNESYEYVLTLEPK